ncbi:MAG: hypothetical protein HQ558_06585 [Candidatus Omnitrophica bacterium]|nr:hypothetical protein [Candidatus Omnitrophota bacterium]
MKRLMLVLVCLGLLITPAQAEFAEDLNKDGGPYDPIAPEKDREAREKYIEIQEQGEVIPVQHAEPVVPVEGEEEAGPEGEEASTKPNQTINIYVNNEKSEEGTGDEDGEE